MVAITALPARPLMATYGAEVRTWLRQLDDDASSGALWHRPVFFIPTFVLLGALFGVILGYFGSFALSFALPAESVVPGPDGAPLTVPNDYIGVPIRGGALGCGLGIAAGGLLSVRKWRGSRAERL